MKKTKISALLLTMCLCLAGCGAGTDHSEKQQQLKQEGMELHASGDYGAAIAKYDEALKLADMKVGAGEIDLAYYKAAAQYRNDDLTGAIDTYSAVLAVKESEEGYLGRGLLYIEAGEVEKAEDDLNKVVNETKSPLIKGIVYYVVDQDETAKEWFEKAKKEGEADSVFYLANIYEDAGDHNYAMVLLEEYIASGTAGAEGYLDVGRYYFENGSYEDALDALQAGIALGESGVLKNLMQEEVACYERLGDYENARAKAKAYLESYPEDAAMQKEYEFLKSR